MKNIYYRFLYLLIKNPLILLSLHVCLIISIQYISKRVVFAEEYSHPFMGEEKIHIIQQEKGEICFIKEALEKRQKIELIKIFDKKMCGNIHTIMNTFYYQVDLQNITPQIKQAYEEITKEFLRIYLQTEDDMEMALECIRFCKKFIPPEAWSYSFKITNLNTLYYGLATHFKSDHEAIGETLFLHAVLACLDAKEKDFFDNDEIIHKIFLIRLYEVEFGPSLRNPFLILKS